MIKDKMLYIMGIDWQWIYQRPQILAEKLGKDYDLTVIFPRSIITRQTKLPEVPGIKFEILWTLPFQEKNGFIGALSNIFNAKLFKNIDEYEYIFVGYPLYARYIPNCYSGKIIYDCMDNHEALYPDQKRVYKIRDEEIKLIRRCDLLITSSLSLKKKVDQIAGYEKSILVRNGAAGEKAQEIKDPQKKDQYSLGYIGTVAEWFDFDLVCRSLDGDKEIEYHIIGPVNKRVECAGITYHGAIPHFRLWEDIQYFDCLIMPFKVNEIVAAVDPVKLYEYIAFGKCIVSVFYKEIERFDGFVYFYNNQEEYKSLINWLKKEGFPAKYTTKQREKFLRENSWDARYEMIRGKLDKNRLNL